MHAQPLPARQHRLARPPLAVPVRCAATLPPARAAWRPDLLRPWLMLWLLVATCCGFMGSAWAQTLLPVPALSARVIDQTQTLDAGARAAIEARLAAFEKSKGTQIVVLMVPSTAPEDIAAYAHRVADQWKIGRRDVGDGLLVVVAKDERRMRIEVAKTLEGAVPDLAAARIIDGVMKPAFRNNDFAGGIDGALDHLIGRIEGEPLPLPDAPSGDSGEEGMPLLESLLFFFFLPVFFLTQMLRSMFGSVLTAPIISAIAGAAIWFFGAGVLYAALGAVAALVVSLFALAFKGGGGGHVGGGYSGGGWSSGSSSGGWSSGGGGFSSGGGGDFGGGGASGDW